MKIVRVKQMLGARMASITIVAGFDPEHMNTVRVGIAFQSPQDNFCRKIGRDIAIGRQHTSKFLLSAEDICIDGQIRTEKLLSSSFEMLSKWDMDAIHVSDLFERESLFKRPRWFGNFLDTWQQSLTERG